MAPAFDPTQHPHRRWNPLTRSYVLCSPHRTQRPWQGAQEASEVPDLPQYDPKCFLCPGNKRAPGGQNGKYQGTFVFENDYAALKPDEVDFQEDPAKAHPLLRTEPARGRCYVICFHPSHHLTIARLTTAPYTAKSHILPIVNAWADVYQRIVQENPFVKYIQIFENKGSAMGCSNPHPHGQVWSLDYVPEEPLKELQSQRDYALDVSNLDERLGRPTDHKGRPSLLLNYAKLEMSLPDRPRVVASNETFVAVVPFWGVWPFEVLILPHTRQIPSIAEMEEKERLDLAEIVGETTCRLDNLFQCSFPYSMGIHQRPVPKSSSGGAQGGSKATEGDGEELGDYAQFHLHFYPPLLRSASVRKFLVGFEMMGEPQRDLTAEQAATRIRECGTQHYLAEKAA